MGVILYLVLLLYHKTCPSTQSYLIQLSLQKVGVLPSTALFGSQKCAENWMNFRNALMMIFFQVLVCII